MSNNLSRRTFRNAFKSTINRKTTSFGLKLILGFPSSFSSTHQRNLRCDPLQLLSGHQVVAVRRSHKSGKAARSTQHAKNTHCILLQQSSAPAHKTPPRPTGTSNATLCPQRHSSSTTPPPEQTHQKKQQCSKTYRRLTSSFAILRCWCWVLFGRFMGRRSSCCKEDKTYAITTAAQPKISAIRAR